MCVGTVGCDVGLGVVVELRVPRVVTGCLVANDLPPHELRAIETTAAPSATRTTRIPAVKHLQLVANPRSRPLRATSTHGAVKTHGAVAVGVDAVGAGGRPRVAAWTTRSEYGGTRSSPSTALRSPEVSPGSPRTPYCQTMALVFGSTTMTRSLWSSVAITSPSGSGRANEGWLRAELPAGRYRHRSWPPGSKVSDLAWFGVVHREVGPRAHLVVVGRVADAGRAPRGVDRSGQVHLVDPVPVDLGDEVVPVGHGESAIGVPELCWRCVLTGLGGGAVDAGWYLSVRGDQEERQFLISAVSTSPSGRTSASSGFESWFGPSPGTPGVP